MIPLPPMIPIPTQTHTLHSTLPALTLINPNGSLPYLRPILAFNANPLNRPLSGFTQHDMPEIMLLPLNHPQRPLKLGNPFLQIVVVDQMTKGILQTLLARPQRNPFPELALVLLVAALSGSQCPQVVFFQQGFALIPGAAAGSVEEALGEEFGEDFVFALVLFEAAKGLEAFVDDSGVHPGWGESTQVCALAAFVDGIFFPLLLVDEGPPARVELVRQVDDPL